MRHQGWHAGCDIIHHARAVTFQPAEVAVRGLMVWAISRLRAPPSCA
jgi:hypothetical protein